MEEKESACPSCGRDVASAKSIAVFYKVAAKKKLPLSKKQILCLDCRRKQLALRLIGAEKSPKQHAKVSLPKKQLPADKIVQLRKRPGEQAFKSCCYFCNSGCDCVVYVKDGKVQRVEGDPESPNTLGKLCAKGLSSKQTAYHPDRLTRPLKRVGERGAGQWEPISWDEALDTISQNLTRIRERYGHEGVVLAHGTSRGWYEVFNRFANVYKAQWMGPGVAQCLWPRLLSAQLTLGGPALECPDYDHTKCMLVWGANPPATWPIKAMRMMEAKTRGAPLIVVDPYMSHTAAKADIWLQLRPGTDCALAMGMINLIIQKGLYDRDFVDQWCLGFEELAERVKEFTPEKVEAITWVPRDLMVKASILYASIRPASLTQCVAIEQNADTMSTCRSLAIMAAITGNVDVPGGNIFPMPKGVVDRVGPEFTKINLWSDEEKSKILGYGEFPLLAGSPRFNPSRPNAVPSLVWDAILTGKPYPIRGLYAHGNNAMLAYANTKKVREALLSLDFFATVDFFHTPTTQLADIVLPSATWLERDFVCSSFQQSYDGVHLQQKVAQIGECWSDVTILCEMAKRLETGHFFKDEKELADYYLSPLGISFEDFKAMKRIHIPMEYRKFEKKGFKTPSKKVELTSSVMAAEGGDQLPHYVEPFESPVSTPDAAKDFPLILTTGGLSPVYRHTELRNVPWLREIDPHVNATINDETGLKLGLADGERAVIETLRGQIRVRVKLNPGIHPRVVQVPHGWPGEENVNLVTDNKHLAELVGSTSLRGLLCRVYRGE